MDDVRYQRWWQLHLRVARGETLNPVERAEYEAGLETLDQEEKEQLQPESVTMLRKLRAQVEQLRHLLEQQIAELRKTIAAQERYIAVLEAQLERRRSS